MNQNIKGVPIAGFLSAQLKSGRVQDGFARQGRLRLTPSMLPRAHYPIGPTTIAIYVEELFFEQTPLNCMVDETPCAPALQDDSIAILLTRYMDITYLGFCNVPAPLHGAVHRGSPPPATACDRLRPLRKFSYTSSARMTHTLPPSLPRARLPSLFPRSLLPHKAATHEPIDGKTYHKCLLH